MNSITVLKLDEYNYYKQYFVMNNNLFKRIELLFGKNIEYYKLDRSSKDSVKINIPNFIDLLHKILFKVEFDCNSLSSYKDVDYLTEEYNKAFNNFVAIRGDLNSEKIVLSRERISDRKIFCAKLMRSAIDSNNTDDLEKFIDAALKVCVEIQKIYKKRDLISAKESIMSSLKYFCSNEELKSYNKKIEEYFNSNPLNLVKIEDYLQSLQQLIIMNWNDKLTDINKFIPGKSFKFICHSTDSTKYDGNFHNRFVSASLITEEFTTTYRDGFGFILGADNIIGSSACDMYVDNSASTKEELQQFTSIPNISSIDKIINELQLRKNQNNPESAIYSEIVIDGFHPKAIFCITNGSKYMSSNYLFAKDLEEHFNLPLIDIDLTLYNISKDKLIKLRNELVDDIEKIIGKYDKKPGRLYYEQFDLLWEEYLELKKTTKLQISDILKLYDKNVDLLNNNITNEELFGGKYSDKEIKFTLLKNSKYNLESILNGNFLPSDLKKLSNNLCNYSNNEVLLRLFPNIDFLIKMASDVDISIIDIQDMKNTGITSINVINQALLKQSKLKQIAVNDEIINLKKRRESFENDISQKEELIRKNEYYKKVNDSQLYYSLALFECAKKEEIFNYLSKVIKKSKIRIKQLESIKSTDIKEKEFLSKHRIRNSKEIGYLKKYILNIEQKIRILENDISINSLTQLKISNDILKIKQYFMKEYGINFESYPEELASASKFYDENFSYSLEIQIKNIKMNLMEIVKRIDNLNKKNNDLGLFEDVHKKTL